jgi:hypothetical protein
MRVRRYHIVGNGADGKHVILEPFTGTRREADRRSRELRTKGIPGTWVEYLGPYVIDDTKEVNI